MSRIQRSIYDPYLTQLTCPECGKYMKFYYEDQELIGDRTAIYGTLQCFDMRCGYEEEYADYGFPDPLRNRRF